MVRVNTGLEVFRPHGDLDSLLVVFLIYESRSPSVVHRYVAYIHSLHVTIKPNLLAELEHLHLGGDTRYLIEI